MTRRQPWDLFTVFPAHAGVILKSGTPALVKVRIPRTRGGDPRTIAIDKETLQYSPHTRG